MGKLSFHSYQNKDKRITVIDAAGEFEWKDSPRIFSFFCFLIHLGHYKFIVDTKQLIFAGSDAYGSLIKSTIQLKEVHKSGKIAIVAYKTLRQIFYHRRCPVFFEVYDSQRDAADSLTDIGPPSDFPLNNYKHFRIFWETAKHHRKNKHYGKALEVYLSMNMDALSKRKLSTRVKYWLFRGICLQKQGEPEAAKEAFLLAQGLKAEDSNLNKRIEDALQSIL